MGADFDDNGPHRHAAPGRIRPGRWTGLAHLVITASTCPKMGLESESSGGSDLRTYLSPVVGWQTRCRDFAAAMSASQSACLPQVRSNTDAALVRPKSMLAGVSRCTAARRRLEPFWLKTEWDLPRPSEAFGLASTAPRRACGWVPDPGALHQEHRSPPRWIKPPGPHLAGEIGET